MAVLVLVLALGALLLYLHMRQRRRQNSEMQNGDVLGSAYDRSYNNNNNNSTTSVMKKKKTIRVIPGIYETIGNRPVPQELDAPMATLTRIPHQSVRSESAHQNLAHYQWGRRGSEGSSTPGSISGRIREAEGLGGVF